MICPKCKLKMREFKRSYHKQRKWTCRRCGLVRFERPPNRQRRHRDRR